MVDEVLVRCPFCKKITARVNVHGHEQCEHCHKNIEECCQGEVADNFQEFWEKENKLWESSMQESFRQRDERLKKVNKKVK